MAEAINSNSTMLYSIYPWSESLHIHKPALSLWGGLKVMSVLAQSEVDVEPSLRVPGECPAGLARADSSAV